MKNSIEWSMERLETERVSAGSTGESPATISPEWNESDIYVAPVKESTTRSIDMDKLRLQGIVTAADAPGNSVEEWRMLKRPILFNAFGNQTTAVKNRNLVVVTSAFPGEGKTFTALNLGMSIAMEVDTTVLLVDSDVVRPSLSELLGLQRLPGLIDVLLDGAVGLSDVIVNTDMPRLKVLPSGICHSRSTELLASEQMSRTAAELSDRYPDRIVIFDAPPLLVTSQANVVAHQAGQIILVVEAGETPQQAVKDAITQLGADKIIGTVLNKTHRSAGSGYYGYYGR